MKPRNFPARKLARLIRAYGDTLADNFDLLLDARNRRTKKNRSSKSTSNK
jgi:hypothetical protein